MQVFSNIVESKFKLKPFIKNEYDGLYEGLKKIGIPIRAFEASSKGNDTNVLVIYAGKKPIRDGSWFEKKSDSIAQLFTDLSSEGGGINAEWVSTCETHESVVYKVAIKGL